MAAGWGEITGGSGLVAVDITKATDTSSCTVHAEDESVCVELEPSLPLGGWGTDFL